MCYRRQFFDIVAKSSTKSNQNRARYKFRQGSVTKARLLLNKQTMKDMKQLVAKENTLTDILDSVWRQNQNAWLRHNSSTEQEHLDFQASLRLGQSLKELLRLKWGLLSGLWGKTQSAFVQYGRESAYSNQASNERKPVQARRLFMMWRQPRGDINRPAKTFHFNILILFDSFAILLKCMFQWNKWDGWDVFFWDGGWETRAQLWQRSLSIHLVAGHNH